MRLNKSLATYSLATYGQPLISFLMLFRFPVLIFFRVSVGVLSGFFRISVDVLSMFFRIKYQIPVWFSDFYYVFDSSSPKRSRFIPPFCVLGTSIVTEAVVIYPTRLCLRHIHRRRSGRDLSPLLFKK